MIFFKRKNNEAPKLPKAAKHEKVLTAEGWRRRALKQNPKAKARQG